MRKAYLFIAAALIGMPAAAAAQMSAHTDVTVQATVLKGISISPNTATLDFKTMIAGQPTGNTIDPKTSADAVHFTVSGYNGATVNVVLPSNPTFNTMTYSPTLVGAADVGSRATAGAVGATVTLSGTGEYNLWLGGSLSAPASGTAPGTYSTLWTLTVNY